MHKYVKRLIEERVLMHMDVFPAVAILGPRQCGKSTLIKKLAKEMDDFLYLDLQNRDDIARMAEPGIFFKANEGKTVCLDEIQLLPEIFSDLRSIIDADRRNGRFILLGSASRDLLQRSSETLAGRIGIIELSPFLYNEVVKEQKTDLSDYWFRGGFPDSYLAKSDQASRLWLENFLRTYVERDIPRLGFQIPAQHLMRMLMMTAHSHGQLFNASKIGESLGLTHPTVKRYLDLLSQTFILRTLAPWEANIKKRLVKSQKVFVRDSGLLHRLLQLKDYNQLLGHPVFGSSWEGLVIENIRNNYPDFDYFFYRSAKGEEVDLIIQKPDARIAIECKASTAPTLGKSFYNAIDVIKPDRTYVVAPVKDTYPVGENIDVCGLQEAIKLIDD